MPGEENEEPLLPPFSSALAKPTKTQTQRAIRKTFKGTTKLSNLLPTGSIMIFETLSPILTNNGQCTTVTDHALTSLMLLFCAATCFLKCFTDSFLDERGKLHYGIATFRGLWVVDGLVKLDPDEAAKYKIRLLDVVHGVASVMVFVAVASLNMNVMTCLIPWGIQTLTSHVPVGVGTMCSFLFVWFPSKRNGVPNPVTRH